MPKVTKMTSAHFLQIAANIARAKKPTAYYSMEHGQQTDLPVYSGGLGALSGCTIKSAADLKAPVVAVGLLYRRGYFKQEIRDGRQVALDEVWDPAKHQQLVDLEKAVTINIAGFDVAFRLWGFPVKGLSDFTIPLFLLDSYGYPNPFEFQELTSNLYNAHPNTRLHQEMALGIGGYQLLSDLRIPVACHHLNEGHAAFATVAALKALGKDLGNITEEDIQAVRNIFAFTTHTPVPAGFDRFHYSQIAHSFRDPFMNEALFRFGNDPRNSDFINMAYLALRLSGTTNAVSQLHAQVSVDMFSEMFDLDVPIIGITNGVHHLTWVSDPMAKLLDRFCAEWRQDPRTLKKLEQEIDNSDLRQAFCRAHQEAKQHLFDELKKDTDVEFDPEVFTIGFARRFAGYKRGDMLFDDTDALLRIAEEKGSLQIIYAGKAHPNDGHGQGVLANVIAKGQELEAMSKGKIKVIFWPDYNLDKGKILTSGVDVWLNTPLPPNEASGTSGMKAALNGVPQMSTEDGWWVEGAHDDSTGWTIGKDCPLDLDEAEIRRQHAISLYEQLTMATEQYYNRQDDSAFIDKQLRAIALNGSFFNTHRMVAEGYVPKVWLTDRESRPAMFVPRVSREQRLRNLADTSFAISATNSIKSAEQTAIEALFTNLPGSLRITRYDVHDQAVHINRRWERLVGEAIKEQIIEKVPDVDFVNSVFVHWRKVEEFTGEVMADLLRTREVQIVRKPGEDQRNFRDGQQVSKFPFIIIPEIINGELVGAYKVDFRESYNVGNGDEAEFVKRLMHYLSLKKAERLKQQMREDLAKITSRQELITWMLKLMTAGGFAHMPGYAVEANRVVFFENKDGQLISTQAIGANNEAEHWQIIEELDINQFAPDAEELLQAKNIPDSSFVSRVQALDLGEAIVFGPIEMIDGVPKYDIQDFGSSFDSTKLSLILQQIKQLFGVNGTEVRKYLLLPVLDGQGNILGLFYADNAFSEKSLITQNYRDLVEIFAERYRQL